MQKKRRRKKSNEQMTFFAPLYCVDSWTRVNLASKALIHNFNIIQHTA